MTLIPTLHFHKLITSEKHLHGFFAELAEHRFYRSPLLNTGVPFFDGDHAIDPGADINRTVSSENFPHSFIAEWTIRRSDHDNSMIVAHVFPFYYFL